MSPRLEVRCGCGWSSVVDDLLDADLTHECTLTLEGVDLTTTPACAVPDCAQQATYAGRARCLGDGHPWLLVCDPHKAALERRWSRTRIAWCLEHEQPIGTPALDWRPL